MQVKVKQEYIPATQISISSSSSSPSSSTAFMQKSGPEYKKKQQKEYKHKIKRDKQNKLENMRQNKKKQEKHFNGVNLPICYEDMVKIAQQNVRFFQHTDFWMFGEPGQRQYWRKVLMQLLVGYQEIQLDYNMQKVLTGKQSTTLSTFLEQYPTLLTAIPYLLQKSKQIQQQVLKSTSTLSIQNKSIYNQLDQKQHQIQVLSSSSSSSCSSPLPTQSDDNHDDRKMSKPIRYEIQMSKIIRQLSDVDNFEFREGVVVGRYGVEDIGVMDQIDMMDERKRQYMYTKKKSYLDYSIARQQRTELQQQYLLKLQTLSQKCNYDPQLQILDIKRSNEEQKKQRSTMYGNINVNVNSIQYWLSDAYVQKLQCRLMGIPMRDTRKYLLLQLRQLCI